MSNRVDQDYIEHGFHQIDPEALRLHPPKIKWSAKWHERTADSKLTYLEKLANTMNHAAALLQSERDELATLCEKKEGQIRALTAAMDQNNVMLQAEVSRLNADRHEMLATVADLKAKVRELESGTVR